MCQWTRLCNWCVITPTITGGMNMDICVLLLYNIGHMRRALSEVYDPAVSESNMAFRAAGINGIMRLNIRTLEQTRLPDGGFVYDHRVHADIAAGYVSGGLYSEQAQKERSKVFDEMEDNGQIAVEVFFPAEDYKAEKSYFYGRLDDDYFLGMSLTYLLASDFCVKLRDAGVFSAAERALARYMKIPTVSSGNIGVLGRQAVLPNCWRQKNQIDKLALSGVAVWDCIMDNELTNELSRPASDEQRHELSKHSFWYYIEKYINHPDAVIAFGERFVKYRLRDTFGRDRYPLFMSKHPRQIDSRRCIATVNGATMICNVFEWLNDANGDCQHFWYLEGNQPVSCRRVSGSDVFVSTDEIWEDTH